jgi:hypothetical protein
LSLTLASPLIDRAAAAAVDLLNAAIPVQFVVTGSAHRRFEEDRGLTWRHDLLLEAPPPLRSSPSPAAKTTRLSSSMPPARVDPGNTEEFHYVTEQLPTSPVATGRLRARPFCFNPDRLEALSASEDLIRGTPASSGTQAQANWSALRSISLFDVEDAHQRGGRVQVPALCSFFSLPSLQSTWVQLRACFQWPFCFC